MLTFEQQEEERKKQIEIEKQAQLKAAEEAEIARKELFDRHMKKIEE